MKDQISINTKSLSVNKLDTDFRAEVVASGLIESGQIEDKILIVREKGNKRHVSKDIAKIVNTFSKQDLMEYLYIYTNRNSIYDSIPENIFHQPFATAKKTQEDIINEIRRHRDEEFYARRYFQPFEIAVDQLLIDAQLYERKFDKKNFHSNLKDVLAGYWPILKLLSLKQAVFFIKIIPVIHKLPSNFSLTEKLLEIILEVPVKVEHGQVSVIEPKTSYKTPRRWRLGIDTISGKTFKDGYRDIEITIGPANPEHIRQFMKGFRDELILQQLIVMMLPANIQKKIKLKTLDEYAKFRLSDGKHKAYLGLNTKL